MVTATAPREIRFVLPRLYPKQHAAFFCTERYSITEASTKSGKTVGGIVWLLHQVLTGAAWGNYWWVAPVYPQAEIAFRRLRRALGPAACQANETKVTLALPNGGTVWFKSAEKADNLYGEDVCAAVLDEATRMREEAWHAVRTTLTATRGPVRIISNVKGRRNWAYRLARRAEAGEPDMAYHKITAYDAITAGVLSEAEIEDARRQLPSAVFRELYLAEPSDDEGNPFGLDAVRACVAPLSDAPAAVWGWDLAKSVDWTVGVALDAQGHVCAFHRFQLPWFDTLLRIRSLTGSAPALVDATGVGDPIVEELQRGGGNYEPFKFTAASKQQLMEGLAVAIQQRQVTYPDGAIPAELEMFEYVLTREGVRYSAPEGMHDDCVCALALALRHRRHGRAGVRWLV